MRAGHGPKGGMQRPTQLDDQNRKARPRGWAVLARLVPLPGSASASSVQGLEIRGILLAGIMSRCPTTSSITTLLGDTTAASGSGQPTV